MVGTTPWRVAMIEAGSPGLNIYSHVAMGRGIALLTTVVSQAGYEARAFIEDVCGADGIDWDWVAHADVVGLSAITCTLPRTVELLARVRQVAPQATVIFGGPEPTCAPERSLDAGADLVLRGEGELTFPRLLNVLSGRSTEQLDSIPGIVYTTPDGERREGPEPLQLTAAELDALPLVERALVHRAEGSSVASVWRSRGCASRCDFCEVREIWPHVARRSDERSLAELAQAEADGYKTVFLIDDNAAANKPSFKRFLQRVVDIGYSGMLVTQMRADAVLHPDGRPDHELLALLKRAAAVTIVCVGVESADEGNLAALHKQEDADRMSRGLAAMRRYGLLVHGMFIALHSDTREIIKRNGTFAKRWVTSLQYLFEVPLPGTKRTAEHEADGRILFNQPADLALFDGMHAVIKTTQMTVEEMQERVLREYERFYSLMRVVSFALVGAFGRHRRLTAAQKARIARLRGLARLKTWAWLHVQYKFAPVSLLAVGRARVRAALRSDDYARFIERLHELSATPSESTARQGELSVDS